MHKNKMIKEKYNESKKYNWTYNFTISQELVQDQH